MKRIAPALFAALLAALLAPIAGSVAAQANTGPKGVQLPAETVKLRPSKLAGFEIATQKCAICHSADYIAYQPPAMNQTQWTAEVAKMHGTYGAPIDDNEIRLVGIYLTANYGDAKSVAAADLAVPAPGTSPASNANAAAVTGLDGAPMRFNGVPPPAPGRPGTARDTSSSRRRPSAGH